MVRCAAGRLTTAAHELGAFASSVRTDELPPDVVRRMKAHVLYALACGMAADEESLAPVAGMTSGLGPAEATLIAVGDRAPIDAAAFANGARLHSRAQDDTHFPSQSHLGTTVIPAALALAERERRNGAELVAALVAGYEVAAAVGEELVEGVVARGFRATMVFGTLGAAAACASLLRLEARAAADAIAIATSFAGGLTETWLAGSSEWLWQAGAGARNGLLAARLAAGGASGAATALEGEAGLGRAFGDRSDWQPPRDWGLGQRWRTLEVIYKAYPVCNIAQAPVELASRIAARHDLAPEQATAIRCFLSPADHAYPGTLNRGPFEGLAATLMSVPYCVALGLSDRGATLAGLRRFDDPRLTRLVDSCEVVADERLPPLGARLEVETDDGNRYVDEFRDHSALDASGWDEAVAATDRLRVEMGPRSAGLPQLRELSAQLDGLGDVAALAAATTA